MADDPNSRAIAVAEQLRARAALTDAQRKLLEHSAKIFDEPATTQDTAYLPRELVQVTLPHKNPGNIPVWRRTNGNVTVGIEPGANLKTGESYGYPYGIIPRLLLFWITTEAVRTKSPRLELGSSLSGFMADLGLSAYTGRGKRGDAKRVRNQMERLFWSRIRFLASGHNEREAQSGMQVADETMFWWNPKDPDQATLWGSWIKLSEKFFAAITAYPVPVDIRALKALKRSPLALDLYAWLSYEAFRAHRSGKPRFENWTQLHDHLGAEYKHRQHFRSAAKAAIRKIKVVYPGLKLGDRQGGIQVLPESWPAIQPRTTLINGTFKTL